MKGGPTKATRETADARAPWLRLLMPVLLLALTWQSYVVGTHVHPLATGGAATTLHRAPAPDRRAPATPDSCLICEQIAAATVYLPAPPVTFALPTQPQAWYAAHATLARLAHRASHAWRSRGPPARVAFPS